MARTRFERLPPEKQEALLAAAADEFAARGYEAASLNRIIERAGTSKGSVYYYFEDKADLLRTVVERARAQTLAEIEWPRLEELTRENYWERVRASTLAELPQLEEDSWHMRVMRSLGRLQEEPAAREATLPVLEEARGLARAFLERGRELGVVRTDLPLDLLVETYTATDQAAARWLLGHWEGMAEAEKRALFEAWLDMLRDMFDAEHTGWWK